MDTTKQFHQWTRTMNSVCHRRPDTTGYPAYKL
jgi:hypothetical protein